MTERSLRLAELLAAVSLATDLAHDVPAESALRDALLSVELARIAGWAEPDVSGAYYLALLYHIGCTGAVAAQSRLGVGDDVNVRRWMSEADYTNQPQMMGIAATKIMPRWILAVAEMYQSMTEHRAWRLALTPMEATRQLREGVADHRLDARAVDAVLDAAGQPRPTGRSRGAWPAELTDREVEVLRAITRGLSNKQVAREFHISAATVHTHVIHIYGKIGVNTRAGATLFAIEHDLTGPTSLR